MNLIDIILKLLGGGDTMSKLGSILGSSSEQQTKGAVGAALPAILGAIMGKASTPQGAQEVSQAASQADSGILGNLGGLLGGLGQGGGNAGGGLLGSLLGGGVSSGLASVISKFTGLPAGAVTTLLGFLTPVIMGKLGQQQKEQGLDASGLASLLTSQKDHIAKAMPAGLGSMLGSVPGLELGSLTSTLNDGAATVKNAAAQTAQVAQTAAAGGSSILGKLIPLLLVGALAFFGYKACNKGKAALGDMKGKIGAAVDSAKALTGDGQKIVSGVTDTVTSVTTSLGSIKDAATAEAAIPQLTSATGKLSELKAMFAKLPVPAQGIIGNIVQPLIEKIEGAAKSVLGIPGVGPIIQPHYDKLMNEIKALVPMTA